MKPIKFRAFDTKNIRWLDSVSVFQDGSWVGSLGDEGGYSEPDCVLMQFTGLFDKNGKEIYEECEIDDTYIVKYESPCYVLHNIHNGNKINFDKYNGELKITREIVQQYK